MAQSHQNRIHATVSAFQSASEGMIAALEGLNDSAATHPPAGGGWHAAQIGYHVAVTNDFLSGILTGATVGARPAPHGFQENLNAFSGLPSKIETFPSLVPPPGVTRAQALERLRESTALAVRAIEGLTAERATGEVVDFPFGVISLYQLAEFLGGHVVRHQAQLQRVIAAV